LLIHVAAAAAALSAFIVHGAFVGRATCLSVSRFVALRHHGAFHAGFFAGHHGAFTVFAAAGFGAGCGLIVIAAGAGCGDWRGGRGLGDGDHGKGQDEEKNFELHELPS
jgi:hypothetical protein